MSESHKSLEYLFSSIHFSLLGGRPKGFIVSFVKEIITTGEHFITIGLCARE